MVPSPRPLRRPPPGCGSGSSSPSAPPPQFYGIASGGGLGASDFDRMAKADVGSLRSSSTAPRSSPPGPATTTGPRLDLIVADAAAKHLDLLPTVSGTPPFEQGACTGDPTCASQIKVDTPSSAPGGGASCAPSWRGTARTDRSGRPSRICRATRSHAGRSGTSRTARSTRTPRRRTRPSSRSRDRAIKSVDPNAQVILGGHVRNAEGRRLGSTAWNYLAASTAGAGGTSTASRCTRTRQPLRHGRPAEEDPPGHEGATRRHDARPLTEIGWGSAQEAARRHRARAAQAFNVSPQQAEAEADALLQAPHHHRRSWNIDGVYWFPWKDPKNPPAGLCAFCYSSGLYKANGRTAKPALAAFERFTRRARQG